MHQQLQINRALVPRDGYNWVRLTLITVVEQSGNESGKQWVDSHEYSFKNSSYSVENTFRNTTVPADSRGSHMSNPGVIIAQQVDDHVV